MAKNWTAAEGFKALKGGDAAVRQDIARRFPLFATATAEEIVAALPEHITARKIESGLRALYGIEKDSEDGGDRKAKEEKQKGKAKTVKIGKKTVELTKEGLKGLSVKNLAKIADAIGAEYDDDDNEKALIKAILGAGSKDEDEGDDDAESEQNDGDGDEDDDDDDDLDTLFDDDDDED